MTNVVLSPHFLDFVGVELNFFLAQQVYEIYQDTGETTEEYLARAAQGEGLRKDDLVLVDVGRLKPSGGGRIDKNNLLLRVKDGLDASG